MSKKLKARLLAIPAVVMCTVGTAMAALPESVQTDVAGAKTDMTTAIGYVIGSMVTVWGLLKLASKLGWR
ncbi:major capsid protein [Comamonas sp.]|uniref:major capsid protein n=1 Tax=Comamonas sp. TaxID=34028 RepID=UPI003A8EC278